MQVRVPGAGALMVGLPGPTLDDSTRALLEQGIAGIVLFARSVRDPAQVRDLLAEIRAVAGRPIWLSVDQEGGAVARLRAPLTVWPPARSVGDLADPELAFAVGKAMAAELAAVGFNVDFAPVLDVNTNPDNPVIGRRALGVSAEAVNRVATPLWRGMLAGGVLPCGKHYPGHGDTALDSHFDLPEVRAKGAALEEHLSPFRRAVADGIPTLMSAHVVFPELDLEMPATLSRRITTQLLREEMGFDGVLFSDDTEMKALAARWTIEQIVSLGLDAGLDLLLVCHDHEKARRAIGAAEEWRRASSANAARFEASRERGARVLGLVEDVRPRGDDLSDHIGVAAHQELADRLRAGGEEAGAVSRGVLA